MVQAVPYTMSDTFPNGPGTPTPQAGDVTGALAELERKLRELESELSSIGRRRELGGTTPLSPSEPVETGARLVDEALEPPSQSAAAATAPPTPASPTPAASKPAASPPSAFATPPESARATVATGERQPPSDAQLASLAELRRFRDRLERFARDLADEYDALLGRVMSGLTSSAPPAEASPVAPTSASGPEDVLFEGRVELGVGPFYDMAGLTAFERQLAGLAFVAEASVRRFEASHAVVDVRLAAPVALVRELRRSIDSEFSVREVADGRVLLTFDEA
jgi:hypothetical protein